MRSLSFLLSLFVLVSLTPTTNQAADVPFPTSRDQWVNSAPVAPEQFRGKAVVMIFYEEDCPNCRKKWPGVFDITSQYTGQPVFFVAVNSGTSRAEVQSYARQTGLNWPVIVDSDRSLEQAAGVGEISLQNIHQAAVLMPDGELVRGSYNNLSDTIERGLAQANWLVDPALIPDDLRKVWMQVELRNYAAAAIPLKRALRSGKPETKAAGEAMQAVIDEEIADAIAAANEQIETENKWSAYQTLSNLIEQFKGFEIPKAATEQHRKLSDDPFVKDQIAAFRLVERGLGLLRNRSASTQKRGVVLLKRVAEDHSGTPAAEKAQEILAAFGA